MSSKQPKYKYTRTQVIIMILVTLIEIILKQAWQNKSIILKLLPLLIFIMMSMGR